MNLFLGNLVRLLARKRIARRDAIALAYISQLILTSQTAMARQRAGEPEAANEGEFVRLIAGLRQRVANLPRLAINNLAAPRRSPSPMIRSVQRRTVAKRLIASPKWVG